MTQNDIVRQKLEQRRDKLQQKIAEIDNAERVEIYRHAQPAKEELKRELSETLGDAGG